MADTYEAVVGFDHDPTGTRVDAGDQVPDTIPESVVKTLLRDGVIKRTKPKRTRGGES